MCDVYTLQKPSVFTRGKPIFSSEVILHIGYDNKGSVAKKKGRGKKEDEISDLQPQEAWRQGDLIGCKPPVVK
jgi:hypothetical protein